MNNPFELILWRVASPFYCNILGRKHIYVAFRVELILGNIYILLLHIFKFPKMSLLEVAFPWYLVPCFLTDLLSQCYWLLFLRKWERITFKSNFLHFSTNLNIYSRDRKARHVSSRFLFHGSMNIFSLPREHVTGFLHLVTRNVMFNVWFIHPRLNVDYFLPVVVRHGWTVNLIWGDNLMSLVAIFRQNCGFIWISFNLCRIPLHHLCWRQVSPPGRVCRRGRCCLHACLQKTRNITGQIILTDGGEALLWLLLQVWRHKAPRQTPPKLHWKPQV